MSMMSRAAIERETLENQEMYNPESDYWRKAALTTASELADVMGEEAHREWAEETWPGDTIDALTWKQIWKVNSDKLNQLKKESEECQANSLQPAPSNP